MSFKAWKRIDELHMALKYQWFTIAALVIVNFIAIFHLINAPKMLHVYLPPDMSHGAVVKPNEVPKSTVYSFAFQIFTAINSWPESGTKNYNKNLNNYRNYLSSSFLQSLKEDVQNRAATGALVRSRIMSGVTGMGYRDVEVKFLGNGLWHVNIKLQIVESLDGGVLKNVIMDYPLIVRQVNESIQINPFNLVIAGFYQQPYLIKTLNAGSTS